MILLQIRHFDAIIKLSQKLCAAIMTLAALPLFYGFCQLVIIPAYLLACWKLGWSYAPASDPVWRVLRDSYQHNAAAHQTTFGGHTRSQDLQAVEVERGDSSAAAL